MASSTQKPSSSSSSIHEHNFEVFLSFRGEDTRNNFTDHLFANLDRMGIRTFRDDQLERGEEIKSRLLKTIEESKISIVVFSKNYAHSKWCLDELAKIMECRKETKQIVLPVFYHVDPSNVRNQIGSFGEAFSIHEGNEDEKKVQGWRVAMTEASNLSGCHVNDGYESKYIKEIIDVILKRLHPKLLHVDNDIVGMDFCLKELRSLISSHLHDVQVVGIFGTGGIGKTTIAKIVYNEIQCEFSGASFLENVKERFKNGYGCQLQLQQELLHGAVGQKIELSNINDGINIIKDRLSSKKVLIVIDDVDHLDQLRSLVGSKKWLGEGSRIVVTTRDQHLLDNYGVDITYQAKELHYEEAIQLFSMHAFKQSVPKEDYVNLSKCMVDYAQGLPIALKVLGASLHGMTIDEWKSASDKLKRNLNKEINDVLRISFDGLDYYEKKVFLDIACFFKGEDKVLVSRILDNCNLSATYTIRVLCDRCLITISDNMIQMHDLIQQMGWVIVREECPEDPCKWSRLWDPNDIYDVFFGQKGMKNIETISLNLSKSNEIQFTSKAFAKMKRVFSKMKKLRLLKVYYSDHHSLMRKEEKMCLHKDFEFPSNLRYLHWEGLESLPLNFHGENLVAINLKSSNIKKLWKGKKCREKLKFIDLSHSQQLIKLPKFSSMPNLERLNLGGCISFRKLHSSIGTFPEMKFFKELHLCGTGIKKLPSSIGSLVFLEVLDLSQCSKIEKFADIFRNMGHLRVLDLHRTGIKELPSSIGYLESLVSLNLSDCSNFENFPEIQGNMKCLKVLRLDKTAIKELPNNIGSLTALQYLYLHGTAIKELPNSIGSLQALQYLHLENTAIKELPNSIGSLQALQYLHLENTAIKELPNSIGSLQALQYLHLENTDIKELPNSIGSLQALQYLHLQNTAIKELPSEIGNLEALQSLNVDGCSNLEKFPEIQRNMGSLWYLSLRKTAVKELPCSIGHLTRLSTLHLENCKNLSGLPRSIYGMKCLSDLYLSGCSNVEAFPEIMVDMERFKTLCLNGTAITEVPSSIERLKGLQYLKLENCDNLKTLPNSIGNLTCLSSLLVRNCSKLHKLPNNLRSLQYCLKILDLAGCNLMEGAIPSDLWRLSSLETLDVSSNHIRCIPVGIIKLSKLRKLYMNHCLMLEEIPELPSSLGAIQAHGCPCLKTLSSPTDQLWSSLLKNFKLKIENLRRHRDQGLGLGHIHHGVSILGSNGIPEWISNKSMGCEVRIELPMNWYKDDNFLGFALFSNYLPLDDEEEECKTTFYEYLYEFGTFHGDQSKLLHAEWLPYSCTYPVDGIVDSHPSYDKGSASDPALLVSFFPQIAISSKYRSSGRNNFKVCFRGSYHCHHNKVFQAKSCGMHLIYDQAQDHHKERSMQDHPAQEGPHRKRSRHV